MASINANRLKTQGISAITEALAKSPEAMVSVRGKEHFVVMDIAHYHYLREYELVAALVENQAGLASNHYITELVEAHLARLDRLP